MKTLGFSLGRALAIALVALGSGCSHSHAPALRLLGPRPVTLATTPEGAVRLVEWCWARLDDVSYHDAFTADFQFVFGALDPDGDAYRDTPWTRDDELASFAHLVRGGGANQPAVSDIDLFLDSSLLVQDDPRYPEGGRWHKRIRTSVVLRLFDPINQEVTGFADFFVVRGDSAQIPAELAARGVEPDSTHWFVVRWEDDTFEPTPAKGVSWGSIKARYR